mmetsp:Transcript_45796/g.152814  ORF Transcript_45796/g.152814 Transcript_45796/m.152814 type:complete len:240 (+) Transcript_45796:209-928(+)
MLRRAPAADAPIGAPQRLMPEERRSHARELRSRPAGAAGRLRASAAGPPTDSQLQGRRPLPLPRPAGLEGADGGRPPPQTGPARRARRLIIRCLRRARRRLCRALRCAQVPGAPLSRRHAARLRRRLRHDGDQGVRDRADVDRRGAPAAARGRVGPGPVRIHIGHDAHLAKAHRLRKHGRLARRALPRGAGGAAVGRPQAVQPGGEGADRGGRRHRQVQPRQRRPRRLSRAWRLCVQAV